MVDKSKQGKKNKRIGADFERRVRLDLEGDGWIVSKWQNNVKEGKLVPAKPGRFRMMQTGFPDFIAILPRKNVGTIDGEMSYKIYGVECKTNGYLTKEEKEKCKWLLDNNVFSEILIAKKIKLGGRIHIEYNQFKK